MQSEQRKKVGIMGGTFDPVHTAHLLLGESAYEQFGLDKVLFMPSGNPPHKRDRQGGATDAQRVEMVRRAIRLNPHFELSLAEMHELGYIYTSRTLERLRAEAPDTDYYFIMGADSLFSFDTWYEPQRICDQCVLVAAVRGHVAPEDLDAQIQRYREAYHADIRKLITPNMDISSSQIREWLGQGRSCRYYLPEEVRAYIGEERMYRAWTDAGRTEKAETERLHASDI